VVVAARSAPETIEQTLQSVAAQRLEGGIELLVADGSEAGELGSLVTRFDNAQHIHVPGANLPTLKGEALRRAQGALIAILDPSAAAAPDWAAQIVRSLADPSVSGVGGAVLLDGPHTGGNVAAYLFEYGAFNPPIAEGFTDGDLPGNNVAYKREALLETCGDILAAEGFNKPFLHERIRARGGRLMIQPAMRVRHLTRYAFLEFSQRRFHYGRYFGAVRLRRAHWVRRALYRGLAPVVPLLLMARHLRLAALHENNRRLLPGAAVALCGVCAFWGVGEWLGYWFGPGRSDQELY
jgi:hypothetical protein